MEMTSVGDYRPRILKILSEPRQSDCAAVFGNEFNTTEPLQTRRRATSMLSRATESDSRYLSNASVIEFHSCWLLQISEISKNTQSQAQIVVWVQRGQFLEQH